MGDMISQDEMNELLAGISDDNSGIEHDIIHDFLDDIKTYLGYYIIDENLSFEYKNISKASLNDIKQYSASEVVSAVVKLETLDGQPIIMFVKQYDTKNIVATINGIDLSEVEDGPLNDVDIDVFKSLLDALVSPIGTMINKFSRTIIPQAAEVFDLANSGQITNEITIEPTGYYQADYVLNTTDLKEVAFTFYFPEDLVLSLSDSIHDQGHVFLSGKTIESEAQKAKAEQGAAAPAAQQQVQSQPVAGEVQQNIQTQAPQVMMNNQQFAQPMMQNSNNMNINAQSAEFQQLTYADVLQQRENISLIREVPLEVTVEMGRTQKKIKEILEFSPGTIIELDKIAGDSIDILANGKFIAKGEVVVIDENYGIRITEILGKPELF